MTHHDRSSVLMWHQVVVNVSCLMTMCNSVARLWTSPTKLLLKWTTADRRILSTYCFTLLEVLFSMIVLSQAPKSCPKRQWGSIPELQESPPWKSVCLTAVQESPRPDINVDRIRIGKMCVDHSDEVRVGTKNAYISYFESLCF